MRRIDDTVYKNTVASPVFWSFSIAILL